MTYGRNADHLKNMYRLKKTVLLLFVFCGFSFPGFGQELDISPYIKAWKTKDKIQTQWFEDTKVLFTGVHPREIPLSPKHTQVIKAGKKYAL